MKKVSLLLKSLSLIAVMGMTCSAQAYSSRLYTSVWSTLKVKCDAVKGEYDFQLVLNLKSDYNIDSDPTSMLGYDVEFLAFEGLMSLTGYNNYSNIHKLGEQSSIREMVNGKMKNFTFFNYVPKSEGYSVQLDLHSDDFQRQEAIWQPMGSEAYEIEGIEDRDSAYMTGTLTMKRLESEEDMSMHRDYDWKVFVLCHLSWLNGAEGVDGEY